MKIEQPKRPKPESFCSSFPASLRALQTEDASLEDILSQTKLIKSWKFGTVDLHQCVPLLNRFDSALEDFVKGYSNDLTSVIHYSEGASAVSVDSVLEVLRFTSVLLEHASNVKIYSSCEHILPLIQFDRTDLVLAALNTLSNRALCEQIDQYLVDNPASASVVIQSLTSLALGWGGKESKLSLSDLSSEQLEQYEVATSLWFEYENAPPDKEEAQQGHDRSIIQLSNLDKHTGSIVSIFKEITQNVNVPKHALFPLFVRVRAACLSSTPEGRRELLKIRMLAMTIWFLVGYRTRAADNLNELEPDMVEEVIDLLDNESVPEEIFLIALTTLATITSTNSARGWEVSPNLGCKNHSGILPTLVRGAVADVLENTNLTRSLGIMQLLYEVASVETDTLVSSGVYSSILPLLNTHNCAVLSFVVQTFVALLVGSNSSLIVSLFIDQSGFEYLVKQLSRLVNALLKRKDDAPHLPPEVGVQVDLVRYLFVAVRASLEKMQGHDTAISHCISLLLQHGIPNLLSEIFEHSQMFGGLIYSMATSVFSNAIQGQPTIYPEFEKRGVPRAFLNSLKQPFPPKKKAIDSLSTALSSICLNANGLRTIREEHALDIFAVVFTTDSLLDVLDPNFASIVGGGFESLLRHHPSLRDQGLEVLRKILRFHVQQPQEQPKEDAGGKGEASAAVEETGMDSAATDPSSRAPKDKSLYHAEKVAQFVLALLSFDPNNSIITTKEDVQLLLDFFTSRQRPSEFINSSLPNVMVSVIRNLGSVNVPTVLELILELLVKHLEKIDRKSFLKGESLETQQLQYVTSIDLFTFILNALVRELPNLTTSVTLSTYGVAGLNACKILGDLQRYLLWYTAQSAALELAESADESSEERLVLNASEQSSSLSDASTSSPTEADAAAGSAGAETHATTQQQTKKTISHACRCIRLLSIGLTKALGILEDSSRGSRAQKVLLALVHGVAGYLERHLEFEYPQSSLPTRCHYFELVVTEVRSMLFVDRDNLQTVLLYAFQHVGGVDKLLQVASKFSHEYIESMDQWKKSEKDRIVSGLCHSFHLIKAIADADNIIGSQYTADLMTSVFPGQTASVNQQDFVKDMHRAMLPYLSQLWQSSSLTKLPEACIVYLLETLVCIIGAKASMDAPSTPSEPTEKPQANSEHLQLLMDMGFQQERAERALVECDNNVSLATEWLFSNPEIPAEEEADEDNELALAMAMSLGRNSSTEGQQPTAASSDDLQKQFDRTCKQLNEELYGKVLKLVREVPDLIQILTPVLAKVFRQDESGKGAKDFMQLLFKDFSNQAADVQYCCLHTAALLLQEVNQCRKALSELGAVPHILGTLEQQAKDQMNEQDVKLVSASLLVLGQMAKPVFESLNTGTSSPEDAPVSFSELLSGNLAEGRSGAQHLNSSTSSSPPSSEIACSVDALKLANELTPEEEVRSLDLCIAFITSPLISQKQYADLVEHAALLLCSRLTRSFNLAKRFYENGGLTSLCRNKRHKLAARLPVTQAILRHCNEDANNLRRAMQAEIQCFWFGRNQRHDGRAVAIRPRQFLSTFSHLVCRDPQAFLDAAKACCSLKDGQIVPLPSDEVKSCCPTTPRKQSLLGKIISSLMNAIVESVELEASSEGEAESTAPSQSAEHPSRIVDTQASTSADTAEKGQTPPAESTVCPAGMASEELISLLTDLTVSFPMCVPAILRFNVQGLERKEKCTFVEYIIRQHSKIQANIGTFPYLFRLHSTLIPSFTP